MENYICFSYNFTLSILGFGASGWSIQIMEHGTCVAGLGYA